MRSYARGTGVPIDRSRSEVERILQRYGADRFAYGWDGGSWVIGFRAHAKFLKFVLPVPDKKAENIALSPKGRKRSTAMIEDAWDQECRRRWRALALSIKAKLEMVESGIAEFNVEFLPYVVLPTGKTVGNWLAPQIDAIYASGKMPKALPAFIEA